MTDFVMISFFRQRCLLASLVYYVNSASEKRIYYIFDLKLLEGAKLNLNKITKLKKIEIKYMYKKKPGEN